MIDNNTFRIIYLLSNAVTAFAWIGLGVASILVMSAFAHAAFLRWVAIPRFVVDLSSRSPQWSVRWNLSHLVNGTILGITRLSDRVTGELLGPTTSSLRLGAKFAPTFGFLGTCAGMLPSIVLKLTTGTNAIGDNADQFQLNCTPGLAVAMTTTMIGLTITTLAIATEPLLRWSSQQIRDAIVSLGAAKAFESTSLPENPTPPQPTGVDAATLPAPSPQPCEVNHD